VSNQNLELPTFRMSLIFYLHFAELDKKLLVFMQMLGNDLPVERNGRGTPLLSGAVRLGSKVIYSVLRGRGKQQPND
jgi:hypothetical protein